MLISESDKTLPFGFSRRHKQKEIEREERGGGKGFKEVLRAAETALEECAELSKKRP